RQFTLASDALVKPDLRAVGGTVRVFADDAVFRVQSANLRIQALQQGRNILAARCRPEDIEFERDALVDQTRKDLIGAHTIDLVVKFVRVVVIAQADATRGGRVNSAV